MSAVMRIEEMQKLAAGYAGLAGLRQAALASLNALYTADPLADGDAIERELDALDEALDVFQFRIAATPARDLSGVETRLAVAAEWIANDIDGAGSLVRFILADVRALLAGDAS